MGILAKFGTLPFVCSNFVEGSKGDTRLIRRPLYPYLYMSQKDKKAKTRGILKKKKLTLLVY